jgi:3-methyl-2-oxobutanoate hydroxymethyltransferase
MAELEVVPAKVAAEISKRTSMLLLSIGAGDGCDGQYLFAEDVLGQTDGHMPRHAKTYRNFHAEYARLQQERIAAFEEFAAEVKDGSYPVSEHTVGIHELANETVKIRALLSK